MVCAAPPEPYLVGIAFLRGDPRRLYERAIMDATFGPYTHTEFFVQKGTDVRFYSAVNLARPGRQKMAGGFMPSARLRGLPDPHKWQIVRYPVTEQGYKAAYALVLQLLALQLPYNARDLWQCCISVMLPFEKDLDCSRLESWRPSGVFCSQVCLLLLRRLHSQGVLRLPAEVVPGVYRTNSRGCSPNGLFRLLAAAPAHA